MMRRARPADATRLTLLILALAGILAALFSSGSPMGHARAAGAPPTTLGAQLAAMEAAVAPYRDFDVARREGWTRFGDHVNAMGEHWQHGDWRPLELDEPFDPARFTNLMYSEIDGERRLIGVAYGVRLGPLDPLPEGFAGSGDRWHVHDFEAIHRAATAERPILRWLGRQWLERSHAPDGRTRLAMVHVWLGENPLGRFANRDPRQPYDRLGLGEAHVRAASIDGMFGTALAHAEGCANELDATFWIADVPRERRRVVRAACAEAAETVRGALGAGPEGLDRVAAAAWQRFEAVRAATLTPAEQSRIASLTEDGDYCGDIDGRTAMGAQ